MVYILFPYYWHFFGLLIQATYNAEPRTPNFELLFSLINNKQNILQSLFKTQCLHNIMFTT